MDTRKLIDYAMDDNGSQFRSELYASIHDRVTAAIEAKKQEIAQNLVTQESIVNEGTMTHITLGKKVKNSDGGHDQTVHYKGKKIGKIGSYSHGSGTKYYHEHPEIGDMSGHRSPEEAISALRADHAEHMTSDKTKDQSYRTGTHKSDKTKDQSYRTGTHNTPSKYNEALETMDHKGDPEDDKPGEMNDSNRKKPAFPSGKGPSIFSKDKSSSGGKITSPKSGVTRHSSGDRY